MNTRTLIASLFVAALLLTSGTAAFAADTLSTSNSQNTNNHWGGGHGGGHGGGCGGGYGGGYGR